MQDWRPEHAVPRGAAAAAAAAAGAAPRRRAATAPDPRAAAAAAMWCAVVGLLLSVPAARGVPQQQRPRQVHSDGLAVASFTPLPVGSITPDGWLLEQLKLQAEGLSGHLAMFWPPVAESVWAGGNATEHIPGQFGAYWLNGLTPLAFQLQSAGIDTLHPKCSSSASTHPAHNHTREAHDDLAAQAGPAVAVGPVRPMKQAQRYIDGIMNTVGPDGWIGPANPGTPITPGPVPQPTATCKLGENLYGGDLAEPHQLGPGNATSTACKALCEANDACAAYVFHQCGGTDARATCWLKAGGWKPVSGKWPANCCASSCSQILRQPPERGNGDLYWAPSNAVLSLIAYAEGSRRASPSTWKNVSNVVLRHFLRQKQLMVNTPLSQWARARWVDMALAVAWLLDNGVAGSAQENADLLQLGHMLHAQGTDWDHWFNSNFTECLSGDGEKQTGLHCVHNVNVAQGLKASGENFCTTMFV
eukprot:COSAG06_NODE_4253_length_4428_cov_56.290829_1_plen_474_part_00